MADGCAIQAEACFCGTEEDFLPPRWLRNPHLQSIFSTLLWPRTRLLRDCREILAVSRREIVDCGAGVRLLAYRAAAHDRRAGKLRRLAVLLHGWEGSANSPDVVSLAQHLFEQGFDVVRLNLRDHGETQHLNVGLFHSCRLAEVLGAVRSLQARHPSHELSCVGFSLGGNFGLRLGARARTEGLDIAHIVAVCPVIDPAHALARLDSGPGVYRRYLMRRWRRSLIRKSTLWPSRYDFHDMLQMSSLTQMADHFVRRYTSFPSLQHYLRGYTLLGDTLGGLDVSAWLVAATDDPIIPARDIECLPSLRTLRVTRTRFGGHCGYYDGKPGPSWLERRIERTLRGA
jgi:predicted alpha/beta-fold hydrolase